MSKQNNVNPDHYYDGDRNRQGEGIVQHEHKQRLRENEQDLKERKEGEPNFIPGEAPVGEKSGQ
ncbi:MAG TPA: hypothetical protein VM779_14860 [Thermoanaerobaculia bacterium]|nr:hypothetical protein [Thermoanaerobaculia bacterium]